MERSIYSLIGFTIGATDGEIGKVKDFYFDDQTWKVRYVIVETGSWLIGRKVLLSPICFQTPYWDAETFPVNLSKEQIKNSPPIDTEKPVSRQQEEDLHNHYSWPYDGGIGFGFMTTGMIAGVAAPGVSFEEQISGAIHDKEKTPDKHAEADTKNKADPHLRSFKEVTRYTVISIDDEIGNVDDFLIDDQWRLTFMVIETGNWFSGKKILARTDSIKEIEWESSSVYMRETRDYIIRNQQDESLIKALNL